MFFKDFVSVKREKIKKGASQTYDTPSSLGEKIFSFLILTEMTMTGFDRNHPNYKVK